MSIYRSILAGIECTMEDGRLFVRSFVMHECGTEQRGPWTEILQWNPFEHPLHECLYSCVNGGKEFCVPSRSDHLRHQIERLQAELARAEAEEAADRPVVR
jgi:hypothetical protein